MKLSEVDIKAMSRATQIPEATIEEAFQNVDVKADEEIVTYALAMSPGVTSKPYEYLYRYGRLVKGSAGHRAALRRAAADYLLPRRR